MPSPPSSEASFILVDDADGQRKREETPLPTRRVENVSPVEHPSCSQSYTPGSSFSYAHDWSPEGTGGPLRTHGRHFIDKYGRVCNLRGVNLSGSSKTPVNDNNETFPADPHLVNFVGRPFPLEEAHEHFSRLRRWGLSFIRFLVTWEAVEHQGPGVYDTDYLSYLHELLALLPQYGLVAFVVVHQDVWSRYSGGSGAPAWTLEAVGFDLHELEATGAAWLRGVSGGGHTEEERGLWPCGYHKLAAATMATCFWAGDTFAPKLLIRSPQGESVPVQKFLQNAFLDMFEIVMKSLGDLEGVVGFEMMNEPHPGYINVPSLNAFNYNTDLHLGYIPSAFESFQLGAGHSTEVSFWNRSFPFPTRKSHTDLLNTERHKVWKDDGPSNGKCIWEMHGVWGWDMKKNEGVILRQSYFVKDPATGRKVDFYDDFFYPLLHRWADRVQNIRPDKLVFIEVVPNEFCPKSLSKHKLQNLVYAPHWYDLNALFSKAFGDFSVNVQGLSRGMFLLKALYWGHQGARDNYAVQIRNIIEKAYGVLGEKPVIIGETGVPMDMNKGEAFFTDDWSWQARMMDAIVSALDSCLVGFTLWNYNPYNDDQSGDSWNGENFSWFSRKRALPPSLLDYGQSAPTLDNGGRILPSIVRPYPAKTAGIPYRFKYEMTTGEIFFEWRNPSVGEATTKASVFPPLSGHPTLRARETEIFLPSMLTIGRTIKVGGLGKGDQWAHDQERQTLFIVTEDSTPGKKHKVEVTIQPPLRPAFRVNDFWSDFGGRVLTLFFIFFAILAYWLS